MSLFSYNRDIPNAPNNPSNDQPKMKVNTNSTQDLLNVDHVTFNATPGGTHKQVTISSKNTPGAQTDPQSVLYTANGTASTVAELFYRNQSGIYLLSMIKAFGLFNTQITNGAVPIVMAQNVVSITSSSNGQVYTVSLTSGYVIGTTVMVFTNLSNDGTQTWSYALNTLTLNTNAGSTGGQKYSFAILQI